ncbi:exodeoxyribonuclease III [Marinilactibacillus psychrotolerans]|uniref:Exodeoxyribonuclease III n=1 Tax=Marinilactibacillus psychrotolerans TaxID=191770 RepID=A0AAV3WUA4_9LACT|nr:exodeoxyribonuclease III [Marinilactibacillus psychrotolerans]GEL66632.1 exodeoxyribonuclease III [Marinilactibacillus psychrotolerans]GEQ35154.1 exodeoxyribonuclease III [Marinilactibacillus psychrotolerans]SDC83785.1 exodeoxyribonuclease-3 [Marinilactibacillus psychrotolerans]
MKLISWNVNGLRAIVQKDFLNQFKDLDADFFCLQEIKLQEGQIDLEFDGYTSYWNYADKKGYSGTAIYTKYDPTKVIYGIGIDEHDSEGRVITLEYDDYFIVTCYTPNSQSELKRIDYRLRWEKDFQAYIRSLDSVKPVILCGDLNVAHKDIDLKNPDNNRSSAGFSDEERSQFTAFLQSGFIDTFRYFYPDQEEIYSWWNYRFGARKRNAGWRIDYFIVSKQLEDKLVDAKIHTDYTGSDHCPVELQIDL